VEQEVAHSAALVQKSVLKVAPLLQVTVQMVLHGQSSVPPHPSEVWPQSSSVQPLGVHIVVVVVDAIVVVVVVVVVVSQLPASSQTSSLVHFETQALLTQVRHSLASQPPQLRVPPQPSETIPQLPAGHDVAGVQQVPLKTRCRGAQQRPNMAGRELFFATGFAQFRLQQLMSVEHTVPFDLQPPARASVLTRSMMLATSARRAVRQNDLASNIVGHLRGAQSRVFGCAKSRKRALCWQALWTPMFPCQQHCTGVTRACRDGARRSARRARGSRLGVARALMTADAAQVSAATLPPFSNMRAVCARCGARWGIRVHFDRDCALVRGDHFHRICR